MNNKYTNAMLSLIAACVLLQTVASFMRKPPMPVIVDTSGKPVVVEISNSSVPVSLDESIQLGIGIGKTAIPVSIEGFNGRPFLNSPIVRRSGPTEEGLPVTIVK